MEQSYIIIYQGDISDLEDSLRNNGIEEFIILNDQLASIYPPLGFQESRLNDIKGISWWERSSPMSSLIKITDNLKEGETVRTAAGTDYIYKNPNINASGKKVIIVIIDSGIDYLHPDFINKDGTSKIVSIWNQESNKGTPPKGCVFGTEFTRDDINKAIKENDPSLCEDRTGTGTMAAGIACGNGNLNSAYEGVAIDSELLIIKLREYKDTYKTGEINYEMSDFLAAIKYVVDIYEVTENFLIVNLTVGANPRATIVATLLDSFSQLSDWGITIVGGAGNEGNTDIHYEGRITDINETQDILIQVGEQKNLQIDLSLSGPGKIGAGLISPAGETSYTIQYAPDYYLYKGKFNLENTTYEMRFIYPWLQSGTQELTINLINIKPGIWTLRLYPEFIISGIYDIYLPNKVLISQETRFIDPVSTATITLLATVDNVITVGGYNDKTDSIWIGSSKGNVRTRASMNVVAPAIDIVAPGVDIISTYKDNSYNTATGTGVSSSLTSGVLALIMDYIYVQTDFSRTSLFTQPLKTYLMLGATRSEIYNYPNISQGYGRLNLQQTIIQIANNLE